MKVTTWQAPNGETINLTRRQESMLETNGLWPKNSRGEEYRSVSHGLHEGTPTFGKDDFEAAFDGMKFSKRNR